ncbi:MAG TPA: S8 family serine peptidase, partial [bacterium]|nr:S8 family serine peptidase [bacterium]
DCFQWILAPTDLAGENPDPLMAPHVVNNSWGYSGGNDPVFEDDIDALVAAGIFIEVSAGNEGPGCQTLRSPGDYDSVYTTGSTRQGGLISDFSSRGPSRLYPASPKPDICAPGQNIRSSVPGGGYEGGWSGTSMAGPHTAGMVALLWSAQPDLIGDIDQTIYAIEETAIRSNVSECSGGRVVPNNVYGWGEIDCYDAVQRIFPAQSAGNLIFHKPAYMCSDTLQMVLKDSDIAGAGTIEIMVESTTEPTPELAVLNEQEDGVFVGIILLVDGSPSPDGMVQVAEGDTITATYQDSEHGGSGPMDVTREAPVDCTAPVISDLSLGRVSSTSASISWTTDEGSTTGIMYGETAPLSGTIGLERFKTEHTVLITGLEECTDYLYAIMAWDAAGNMVVDDNGGAYYPFKTYRRIIAIDEPMDTDPGWATEGDWAFGVPQGKAGDPTSGFTGDNVYGYNLDGAYENNMPVYALTSPSFDLTSAVETTVGYALWVGVGAYPDDQISWDVSLDGGTSWIPLFNNSYFGGPMQMDFWVPIAVPLGDLVDGYPDVRFRWTMGPTDDTGVFAGWNIDDFTIEYDQDCDAPTPTPRPTATPQPTATPTQSITLGVRLDMPDMAHPGQMFHITGYLDNPGDTMQNIPVFFILDVYGDLWFWPGWIHFKFPDHNDIDYRVMDVLTGSNEVIVLPEFTWPDTGSSSATGLNFYGAMLDEQMSGILGDMAYVTWGYGP